MGLHWQTTFHAVMLAWYLLVDLYLAAMGILLLLSRWDIVYTQFGGGIQYLTMWNFGAQHGYFILSLKEDLLPNSCRPIKSKLRKFLTFSFHALIFPMGLLVAIDFWVIYKIDPALVDKYNILQGLLLSIANHVVHSTIVPIVLLELAIADRPRKSITLTDTFVHLLCMHMIYLVVVCVCYQIGHVWPYPFLDYLSFTQKVGLAVLNSAAGTAVAYVAYAAKTHIRSALETLVKLAV